MDLSAFKTSDLLSELNRRVKCAEKKTITRTILIGAFLPAPVPRLRGLPV